MKKIFKIYILFILITFFITLGKCCYGAENFSTGTVTTTTLNIRSGAGKEFGIVDKIKKNSKVKILAEINDWYVVQTEKNIIGAVSKTYISTGDSEIQNTTTISNETVATSAPVTENVTLSNDEKLLFEKINSIRKENSFSPLTLDSSIQEIAELKASDLVENNYFSHYSPEYGTLTNMFETYKLDVLASGENIAGNSSIENAISDWMNSETNKQLILDNQYSYTGISIVESPKYGKIIVQIFAKK